MIDKLKELHLLSKIKNDKDFDINDIHQVKERFLIMEHILKDMLDNYAKYQNEGLGMTIVPPEYLDENNNIKVDERIQELMDIIWN